MRNLLPNSPSRSNGRNSSAWAVGTLSNRGESLVLAVFCGVEQPSSVGALPFFTLREVSRCKSPTSHVDWRSISVWPGKSGRYCNWPEQPWLSSPCSSTPYHRHNSQERYQKSLELALKHLLCLLFLLSQRLVLSISSFHNARIQYPVKHVRIFRQQNPKMSNLMKCPIFQRYSHNNR